METIETIINILSIALVTVAVLGTAYAVISIIRLERGAK